jgi:hypothetical protein
VQTAKERTFGILVGAVYDRARFRILVYCAVIDRAYIKVIKLRAMRIQEFHRREFLRFLAASPFAVHAFAHDSAPAIARAQDALNVMDFEPLAHKALPPAHWDGSQCGGPACESSREKPCFLGSAVAGLRPRTFASVGEARHGFL